MVSIHSALYRKKSGGTLSRFAGTSHHANKEAAALDENHPAIKDVTTIFPKSVFTTQKSPRLLIPGHNNPKVGSVVTKGDWEGAAIYTLSLVERETCPRTCQTWRECYGNAMPLARRHRPDSNLRKRLAQELDHLIEKHGMVAVRLHVLGDFFSVGYVQFWASQLDKHRDLLVWGYTAHRSNSKIGHEVWYNHQRFGGRWVVRNSNGPDDYLATGIIWRQPEAAVVPEGQVCPASMEKTASCGTCGLCWNWDMLETRIVFVGHGMNKRGKGTST